MRTSHLPTVAVLVASTRCQYWWRGKYLEGAVGVRYLPPRYLPPWDTYLWVTNPWDTYIFGYLTHQDTSPQIPTLWIATPQIPTPGIPTRDNYPPEGTWDRDIYPLQKGPRTRDTYLPSSTEWLTDACENITFPQLL